MMKKLKATVFLLLFMTMACSEEVVYDFDTQLVVDLAIIDQYLADNNIDHLQDDLGLRYEVLETGQGQVLQENQYAEFEVTFRKLDGSFYGSSNPDIDRQNGGNGNFNAQTRLHHEPLERVGFVIFSIHPYFQIIAPKMALGDRYRVYVPSGYGYGFEVPEHVRPIAPNTNLIVEIEMKEIIDYN